MYSIPPLSTYTATELARRIKIIRETLQKHTLIVTEAAKLLDTDLKYLTSALKEQKSREKSPTQQPTMTIDKDDIKEWRLNGKLHREDGPAVEYTDGTKFWYLNGKLHREDGPAIENSSDTKAWWLNGKRHREDGPAIEWADDDKEWYLNGKQLSEAEWRKSV